MSYWDQALEGAKEESSGGVIGKARIVLGYWAYVRGLTGDDRRQCLFVPKPANTDEAQKRARQQAKKEANAFAAGSTVQWSVVTILYREYCLRADGSSVKWSADQFEVVPIWPLRAYPDQPSAAKLVLGVVEKLNITGGEDFYGRFGWTDDPYSVSLGDAGKTAEDQDGNRKFPDVCYVIETYPNRETALAAVNLAAEADSDELEVPAQWQIGDDGTAWKNKVRELMTMPNAVRDALFSKADEAGFVQDIAATVQEYDAWTKVLDEEIPY